MKDKLEYPLIGYYSDKNGVRLEEPARLENGNDVVRFIRERADKGFCYITDMLDHPVLMANGNWIIGFYRHIKTPAPFKELISKLDITEIGLESDFKGENGIE